MTGERPVAARQRRTSVGRTSRYAVRKLVPDNGNLSDFIDAVATHRQRPIVMLDAQLPPDAPSGLWVQLAATDYIVCAEGLSVDHRRVVVCHELAHMLLDHQTPDGPMDARSIAPSIAPDVAARFLTRHGYEDRLEADAETLATVLAAELAHRAFEAVHSGDNVSARLR